MPEHVVEVEVLGPWSLATSRRFWEGFTPAALTAKPGRAGVVLRGANTPDGLPRHESRLNAEIGEQYGPGHTLAEVSQGWRPYRTWAAVHLRAVREQR